MSRLNLDQEAKRQLKINQEVRSRYSQMKLRNEREDQLLQNKLLRMRKATIDVLGHHLTEVFTLSRLLEAKAQTTGWFEEAITEGDDNGKVNNSVYQTLKATLTPWQPFTGGTLEYWEKNTRAPIRPRSVPTARKPPQSTARTDGALSSLDQIQNYRRQSASMIRNIPFKANKERPLTSLEEARRIREEQQLLAAGVRKKRVLSSKPSGLGRVLEEDDVEEQQEAPVSIMITLPEDHEPQLVSETNHEDELLWARYDEGNDSWKHDVALHQKENTSDSETSSLASHSAHQKKTDSGEIIQKQVLQREDTLESEFSLQRQETFEDDVFKESMNSCATTGDRLMEKSFNGEGERAATTGRKNREEGKKNQRGSVLETSAKEDGQDNQEQDGKTRDNRASSARVRLHTHDSTRMKIGSKSTSSIRALERSMSLQPQDSREGFELKANSSPDAVPRDSRASSARPPSEVDQEITQLLKDRKLSVRAKSAKAALEAAVEAVRATSPSMEQATRTQTMKGTTLRIMRMLTTVRAFQKGDDGDGSTQEEQARDSVSESEKKPSQGSEQTNGKTSKSAGFSRQTSRDSISSLSSERLSRHIEPQVPRQPSRQVSRQSSRKTSRRNSRRGSDDESGGGRAKTAIPWTPFCGQSKQVVIAEPEVEVPRPLTASRRFHVRPTESVDENKNFIRRRYLNLQRQIAQGNVAPAEDVRVQPSVSGYRKKRLLEALQEHGKQQIQKKKPEYKKRNLDTRVQDFLNDIDNFVSNQKKEGLDLLREDSYSAV